MFKQNMLWPWQLLVYGKVQRGKYSIMSWDRKAFTTEDSTAALCHFSNLKYRQSHKNLLSQNPCQMTYEP